ncbi:hypothetical protein IQ241_02995 [Romeria aff. gracilis LEGE 07310]|uniref:Uncharacterized protein n=1 Tax=Vasconcelosia minhoensis LEGE 07310 TaxID=915328 RepID=A0A8J7AVD6_9CYAN|nr:hypothetical protein [Romeria gracilis]MBE9076272.1 hypothetical protein [Romeria aff. gracilis LEGE 07310]
MASSEQVRDYLAHWFQLGKRVVLRNGETIRPDPVIRGEQWSPEFDQCWSQIMQNEGRECYLEGTTETIAELLSEGWEVTACSRCAMPIAMPGFMKIDPVCPCSDLSNWPNNEVPAPRQPVRSRDRLSQIGNRLRQEN